MEKEELFKLEPHINPNSVAALLAPDAGMLWNLCDMASDLMHESVKQL